MSSVEKQTEEILNAGSFDFDDAGGKSFPVSIDEMSVIKAELATEFPEQLNYLSDAYIKSVASKPYSKNKAIRRPLSYTIDKFLSLLRWREESGAIHVFDLVKYACLSPKQSLTEGIQRETYDAAVKLANTMNNNSIYIHGYDTEGRPIVWIRTERKPWFVADVEAEVRLHILMTDFAISMMPANVTDFVVIADSTTPPPPSPSFLISTLKGLVRGYPDRLKMLFSAPMGTVMGTVMNLLVPLMPGALGSKLKLMNEKEEIRRVLASVLKNGDADVPTFFGGPADHDRLYPKEGLGQGQDIDALGDGVLMFDWKGMKMRQEEMMEEWK